VLWGWLSSHMFGSEIPKGKLFTIEEVGEQLHGTFQTASYQKQWQLEGHTSRQHYTLQLLIVGLSYFGWSTKAAPDISTLEHGFLTKSNKSGPEVFIILRPLP